MCSCGSDAKISTFFVLLETGSSDLTQSSWQMVKPDQQCVWITLSKLHKGDSLRTAGAGLLCYEMCLSQSGSDEAGAQPNKTVRWSKGSVNDGVEGNTSAMTFGVFSNALSWIANTEAA